MTSYQIRLSGTVLRDDGAEIPPDPRNTDYAAYLEWVAEGNVAPVLPAPPRGPADLNSDALRAAALGALATNRNQAAENAAIVTKADVMIAFGGASLTQAQIISTLKDLAIGVKALAIHDQANKDQLNKLIRLIIGKFDGTD